MDFDMLKQRHLMGLIEGRTDWQLDEDHPVAGLQWESRGSWRVPESELTEAELLERMRAKPVQSRFLPPHIKKFVKQTGDVKTVSKVKDAPDELAVYVWSTSGPGVKDRYHSTGWETGRNHPVFIGSHFKASDMYKNMKYEIGRWEMKQKAKAIPHDVGGNNRVDVGKLPPHVKSYLNAHLQGATAARQVATPKGMLAYTWEAMSKGGKLRHYAAIWKGRAKKPAVYSRYLNEKSRDKDVEDHIRFWKEKIAGKAAAAAKKKAFTHDYKVGDILYNSWGYDQTNVDFYEVVGVPSGKTIKIRKVGAQIVGSSGTQEQVVPTKGIFARGSKVMSKRVDTNGSVKVGSNQWARKWHGKPISQTSFGFGH